MRLTWPQVLAWRVHQHYLDAPAPTEAWPAVANRLCGLHAQLMSSAELTLWVRLADMPRDLVQTALWEQRSLVKSWATRGTLHLFTSADFPTWQAGLSLYRHYLRPVWLNHFGVTHDELEQLIVGIGQALEGEPLTRQELAERVTYISGSPKLGEKVLHSWGSMLKPAAFRGYLCFAPSTGQNVRFTRPDRWLPTWQPVDPTLARLEVARRYLHAYGPSTAAAFGRWRGVSSAEARRTFTALGDSAMTVDLDGSPAWALTDDLPAMRASQPCRAVRLLPAFDQYVIGAPRDAAAVLNPSLKARVYRSQGWISPVLLVDGQMRGVWRHIRKGSQLLVDVEPFTNQPVWVRRAAEREAERLTAFLGGSLDFNWSTEPRLDAMQDQTEDETPGEREPAGLDA
jgi:hypothetical protein